MSYDDYEWKNKFQNWPLRKQLQYLKQEVDKYYSANIPGLWHTFYKIERPRPYGREQWSFYSGERGRRPWLIAEGNTWDEIVPPIQKELVRLKKDWKQHRSRTAGLPKIPGLSAARFSKLVAELRQHILETATDAYQGAEWTSEWRVKSTEPMVLSFVDAHGESDGPEETSWGWGLRLNPETLNDSGRAAAKAVSGTWKATVVLGWKHEYMDSDLQVGDIHYEHSDAFYRGGNKHGAVEVKKVPITMKVRASYRKRDQSIAFRWSWKT